MRLKFNLLLFVELCCCLPLAIVLTVAFCPKNTFTEFIGVVSGIYTTFKIAEIYPLKRPAGWDVLYFIWGVATITHAAVLTLVIETIRFNFVKRKNV